MRYVHKLFSGRHAGRPAAVLTVALGLAFACSEVPTQTTLDDLAPQFGHKGESHGKPGGSEDPPTVTVEILTMVQGAGIYGIIVDVDGGGTNVYSATLDDSGDLKVSIDCPDGAIKLDLPDEDLLSPFDAEILTCAGGKGKSSASPRITVPDLVGTGDGIIGVKEPDFGPNYGDVMNYYFVVGRTGYNLVYWTGINVSSSEVEGNCIYELTTDPDLAGAGGNVELWERAKQGPVKLAAVEAHLDMTVTVDGACP